MAAENSLEQFRKAQKEYQDRQKYLEELTQQQTPSLSDISNMVKEDNEYGKIAGDNKKLSTNDNTEFTLTNPERKDARQVVNEYLQGKIKSTAPETTNYRSLMEAANDKLNDQVNKLSENKNSPVNSLDDLLTRFKTFNTPGYYKKQINEENKKNEILSPEMANKIPDIQNTLNSSLDEMLPKAPASVSGESPLTPEQLSQMSINNTQNTVLEEPKKIDNKGVGSTNLPPTSGTSSQLDPLAQFQQLLKLQEERQAKGEAELSEAQKQRDINSALGMITSGISKAAAGYGGGSVTQLKGDTSAEEMLKQTADQKITDIKERMKTAGDTEKKVLERQLTLAQLQKMRDDKSFNDAKLALERDKIRSDEKLAEMKVKDKPNADEVNIYKENRKTLEKIDKDELTTKELLKDIKDAKEALLKYGKTNVGGTGWFSQGLGVRSKLSQDAEILESKLSNLSLDTLVKKFQGMSKAVDTERDRAEFEKTIPSMLRDDQTNLDRLNRMEELAKNMLTKQQNTKALYTREGRFAEPQQSTGVTELNQPQEKTLVKKQYSPSANKTKLVYSDGSEEILDGKQ